MKNKMIFSLIFIFSSHHIFAELSDSILIQAVTTNQFVANGYISVKDNFKQVRIYPKSWLEKISKTKIENKDATVLSMEVTIKDINEIHDDCMKTFKKVPSSQKLCPQKL